MFNDSIYRSPVGNYPGKLTFSVAGEKFSRQEQGLKRLTEENDIAVKTINDNRNIAVAVAKPGELETDVFDKQTDTNNEFACMKTDYEELKPTDLYSYTQALLNKFNFNRVSGKPQSYYVADKQTGFNEVTKDEFYRG